MTPLLLADWELSPHWTHRDPARAAPEAKATGAVLRCVEFRLRGARVAMALDGVERLIPRLGRLVPLASGHSVGGVALVGGEPVLVVDLEDAAVEGEPSALRLEERPALVLPHAGGRIALAVSGPADLVEASFEERPLTALGPLVVQGFLRDGVPLLRTESVARWLGEALGGPE